MGADPIEIKAKDHRSQGSARFATVSRSTPSRSAARAQGSISGAAAAGGGAVARMKRSSAATTAAASSGEAEGAISSRRGRRFGIAGILT